MNENGISGFELEELPLGRPAKAPKHMSAAEEALAAPAVFAEAGMEPAAEAQSADTEPEAAAVESIPEDAAEELPAAETETPAQEELPVIEAKPQNSKRSAPRKAEKKPAAQKKNTVKTKNVVRELPEEEEVVRWKMPGILKFLVWLAFTLAASLALAYFAWLCAGDVFALSKPDRTVNITITQQDTLDDVIEVLVEEGLVDYEWLFRIYCSLANAEDKISVGTFTLNNTYDYNALIKGLQAYSGTRETTEVTIPEGYTCKQIFAALEEAGVCTVEELETAAAGYMFDYSFLQHLPYGAANRLEGYLFPDTYEFYINDTPERVLSKFLDNFGWKFEEKFREDIAELNAALAEQMRANGISEDKIKESELDMHDIVIVASLVERETSAASESSKIASVIYNRLCSERYPLLEIDASVRYGLDKWEGTLSNADLSKDTPYNTRKNPGLPAGPISNPGLDSIRAALYPRNTEYYFYVLSPEGSHHFSETYYEHQDYIEEMQKSGN